MTTETPEETTTKKRSILNILGIIGFIAAVLIIAWLSFLFVRAMPGMFSSLASLSDSIKEPQEAESEVVITDNTETTVSGEVVTITWDKASDGGTYTFSHDCVAGVAIEIMNDQGAQPTRCDTAYNLGNVSSTSVRITSDKPDMTTIPYTIAFVKTNETQMSSVATSTLAVGSKAPNAPSPTPSPTPDAGANVEPEQATPETTPSTVTVQLPETRYTTYSYLPVSNPNGYTDLRVRFIEMGEVQSGNLVSKNTFSTSKENFFRFEIRNIGTRTSDEWEYSINLPDGTVHERSDRAPLKPNERAIITVRFNLDDKSSSERVWVTTDTDRDTSNTNDTLTHLATVR